MTTLMASAVTPGAVAPPLSPPVHGVAHATARLKATLRRLVAGSQSGAARAAGVPMPAEVGATGADGAPLAAAVALPWLAAEVEPDPAGAVLVPDAVPPDTAVARP